MDDVAVLGKKGYTLKKEVGEGSYGKVKCAYCDRLKCEVAIKIIDKKKTPRDFLERFLPREIEALKRLRHPSIIKTYEIFETSSGKVYIVMELGKKGDLLDHIKLEGAMKEDIARIKFQQLASAIKHCHDLDFAHRDLKCENILLDEHLNIKLSDFGFSKYLSRDENGKPILSKTFCGSAAYAAPEVLQGIPCDPRISDIWSLGVILYTMVYALMPFDDSNVKKMICVQKQRRIPFPSSQHLTVECKDLIYQLLQPDVSLRMHIDQVLKHSWLQNPKPKTLSPVSTAKEGECSQKPQEGKPEHKQSPKSHFAKGKGEKETDPLKDGWF
ncbi:testis-specific serine/threonine-protein kinase 2 [Columba livia]|uniref:non-specific serine/threonine protein kinase n=1 Tax=Columba livia TaxID=8932 RepID=A0A2I0M8H0_COLLI|nr:testis-specific serine/threonine-protein kinase 2 [Columba livia]PKK25970.1 testis-specific serine kinase 2 [Columba livia]